jgi:ABC-type multidrug transport system fused ATPase/permease subunit
VALALSVVETMMAERPEGSVVENHRHHAHLGKRQVVTAVTSLTAAAVLQCLTGVGLFFISSGDDDDPETQLAAWRLTALMLMGQGLSSFLLALPLLTYSRRHNPLQSSTLLCSRIAAVCTGLTGLFLAVGGLYLLEIQEKEAGKSPWKLWTCLAGAGVFLLFLSCTSLMASYWPTLSSSRQSDHRSHERREDQRPLLLESTEDEVETGSYRLLEDGQQQTTEGAENGGGSRPQEETHSHSRLTGTRRLLQLAAPEVLYLWTGCIVLLIRLPFSLAIPHFVSTTLSAVAHAQFARAKQEIFRLFLLGTVDALLDFWCVFLFGYANQRIVRGLRVDLFAKLLQQEVAFFDVTSSGELASRLNSDCSEMAGDLTWFFRFSIESIVRITGITTYMLIRSPLLGACALSIVPAVGAINKVYGDWLRRNAVQVQDALAEANATAQESLSNVRTIVAFAAEQQQCERYERKIERQYQLNIRQLYATGVYYMGKQRDG